MPDGQATRTGRRRSNERFNNDPLSLAGPRIAWVEPRARDRLVDDPARDLFDDAQKLKQQVTEPKVD